jgi:GrpB-like predicted nucleotidyltransferase (UPF0157 family)
VPYDPAWPERFRQEAQALTQALGDLIIAIHHVGSTSIPGLAAKPIVDVLVEVADIERVDDFNALLAAQRYLPKGEFGIPGRRFFIKGDEMHRTHHVHVFEAGHPDVARHLNFRDYLRAHPQEAAAYGRLKQELAQQYPHDVEAYMDGKDAMIKSLDEKARRWRAGETRPR